jgi:hypothetical protein
VITGSSCKGSPTTADRFPRQMAPAADCGTACPASSMRSQPIDSRPRWEKSLWTEASAHPTGPLFKRNGHVASTRHELSSAPPSASAPVAS